MGSSGDHLRVGESVVCHHSTRLNCEYFLALQTWRETLFLLEVEISKLSPAVAENFSQGGGCDCYCITVWTADLTHILITWKLCILCLLPNRFSMLANIYHIGGFTIYIFVGRPHCTKDFSRLFYPASNLEVSRYAYCRICSIKFYFVVGDSLSGVLIWNRGPARWGISPE